MRVINQSTLAKAIVADLLADKPVAKNDECPATPAAVRTCIAAPVAITLDASARIVVAMPMTRDGPHTIPISTSRIVASPIGYHWASCAMIRFPARVRSRAGSIDAVPMAGSSSA